MAMTVMGLAREEARRLGLELTVPHPSRPSTMEDQEIHSRLVTLANMLGRELTEGLANVGLNYTDGSEPFAPDSFAARMAATTG